MADVTTITYYLNEDGEISQHVTVADEDGNVFGESGDPAPKGKGLSSEELTTILRKKVIAEMAKHDAQEKRIIAAHKQAVKDRSQKVEELVASGLPEAAAEILVPELGEAPKARPFSLPPHASTGLEAYGLSPEQIQRIIGGWV